MKIGKAVRSAINYYYFISASWGDPHSVDEKSFFLSTYLFFFQALEGSIVFCELLKKITLAMHEPGLYAILNSVVTYVIVIFLLMLPIDFYFKKNDRHVKIKRFYKKRYKRSDWVWFALFIFVVNAVSFIFFVAMLLLLKGM